MKQLLLLLLTCLLVQSSQAQVLLWDQSSQPGPGTTAQDFETANDAYDAEIADDFVVPTGETWYIDSIKLFGSYSATAATSSGVKVSIYDNNNGEPGTLVSTLTVPSGADPDGNGSLNAEFNTPVILTADTYWLVGTARKDFGSGGGQWYWTRDSVGFGNDFLWRNPGNGFASGCTSWVPANTCSALNVSEPGVVFRMWGCYGPKPTVSLPSDGDTTLCTGEIPWTLEPDSLSSSLTYYWSTGDTANSIGVDTSGLFIVYAYDAQTQCAATDEVLVDIAETPIPGSLSNDTICEGESITLNGFANCGTCEYIWNDTFSGAFFSAAEGGWHHLSITNPNSGCTYMDSVWLEVESTAPPVLAPGNEVDLCEGDSAYLSVVDTYDGYAWSTFEFTQGITVYDSGAYVVTVTTPSGCEASDTIDVALRPAPEPEIVVDFTSDWKTRLTATAGYQTYIWSTGSGNPVTIANSVGEYTVTVTDEFGCEGEVTVNITTVGINEAVMQQMHIYPNPAHDQLTIEWPSTWVGFSSFDLCDLSGRVLQSHRTQSSVQRLDVSTLAAGYYLIKVHSPEGEGMARVAIH